MLLNPDYEHFDLALKTPEIMAQTTHFARRAKRSRPSLVPLPIQIRFLFNKTTSKNFIAPRRQERKEKYLLRTWRALRLRASHRFSQSLTNFNRKFQIFLTTLRSVFGCYFSPRHLDFRSWRLAPAGCGHSRPR